MHRIWYIFSVSLILAWRIVAQQDGLSVLTNQGPVVGTLSGNVRQFLGVPYATAKRWEPPTLPPRRSKPFIANTFGDSCLQALTPFQIEVFEITGSENSSIFVPESEDCLTINIWTPITARKQNTALLLWVYGGGLQFGTSNFPAYSGQNIVQENDDIIVVTFNYRLNIFGFPGAPQLMNATSQNFGLLDLDAAVQWVHDNILAFGGDPERITLFGQSAGGAAIDAYTLAHPEDTRVKGNICEIAPRFKLFIIIKASLNNRESFLGVIFNLTALPIDPIPAIAEPWNTVAGVVGCGNVPNVDQLLCMEKVPATELENAVIALNTAFLPVSDNITIFSDYPARAAAGRFLHVPLLGGSTKNEGDSWIISAELLAAQVTVPGLTEIIADLEGQEVTLGNPSSSSDLHVPLEGRL
ncbi:hypothetical protein H0H93_011128 [Arthromyces matolae]|nr:hypothetical protein H0H93_011128 [Arthromyces matolae]